MYIGKLKLKDRDYIKLQFLGARNAWLGCISDVCDLRTCPSRGSNYRYFNGPCHGEEFQIIGEGTRRKPIKSGQQIQLRYLHGTNEWIGCPHNNRCDKRDCPGTISQARAFRCLGEIFRIYARGRANGETIYNGDLVMLYYVQGGKYVSIQGQEEKDNTSLDFCPGKAPPAYLSYGICSKNTFRVYRKSY